MDFPRDADELPSEPRLRRATGRKGEEESSAEVNELSAAVVPPGCCARLSV